jgi:hypothetical protein
LKLSPSSKRVTHLAVRHVESEENGMSLGNADGGTHANHSHQESKWSPKNGHAPQRDHLVLWRLLGSADDLTCVVRTTTFGYTLGLELAGEPILLELQKSVDVLVDKASRLEAWLLTQGWVSADDVIE